MPLTPEQIIEMRKKAGIPETGFGTTSKAKSRIDRLRAGPTAAPTPGPEKKELPVVGGFVSGVKEKFDERMANVSESQDRTIEGKQSLASGALQTIGQGAGLVGDVALEGIKAVTPDFVEKGAGWLLSLIGDAIPEEAKQKVVEWAEAHPEAVDNLKAVGNIASLVPIGKGAQVGAKGVIKGTEKVASKTLDVTGSTAKQVGEKIVEKSGGLSESLIANVNKINPSKRREFQIQQGVSEEKWLKDRGIVGTRETTVKELADRFQSLRQNVDEAIEKIPGQYRDERITGVAEESADFAKRIESSESGRITELAEKAKGVGLTPTEINEVKRFYERNVKTGYLKDPTKTAEQVQRATNRDAGIREALLEIADKNGFSNLREINKEIQASKFLADEIAGKMQGQAANNLMSFTDWVVATPGIAIDPAILSGFVAKNALSTETVRAFAAKALSGFPKIKELPRADLDEITKRAQSLLKKQEDIKIQTEQAAILADELKKSGFTMSEGSRGFIMENPIPLTRNEQALIRAAKNKAEQQQIVNYILEQRSQGNAVGDGFVIKEIDNVPILNPAKAKTE
jgi:hypothetical protein